MSPDPGRVCVRVKFTYKIFFRTFNTHSTGPPPTGRGAQLPRAGCGRTPSRDAHAPHEEQTRQQQDRHEKHAKYRRTRFTVRPLYTVPLQRPRPYAPVAPCGVLHARARTTSGSCSCKSTFIIIRRCAERCAPPPPWRLAAIWATRRWWQRASCEDNKLFKELLLLVQ